MKKRCLLAIIFLIALLFIPTVMARKGVGIVWNTETELVDAGSTHCVEYGVYNPWDESVNVELTVSDELKDVVLSQESEVKLVQADTTHDKAVPVEFCFKVADVYEKDCLLGAALCEQRCDQEQVVFEGTIQASEKSERSPESSGSSTALGVSVPLKLKVRCTPYPRDWTALYILIIVLALIGLIIIVNRKRKRKR